MRAAERLGLAHLSYLRAIAAARAHSTPGSWRRLVTARTNLDEAKRAHLRERGLHEEASPSPRAAGREGRSSLARIGGAEITTRAVVAAGEPPWSGVLQEWARALALMRHARALVAQARALQSATARAWASPSLRRGSSLPRA